MQLYRGMDIGTAKLTPAEREGVPHHLLDIWDVTVAASVAEYQRLARAEIDRLLAGGPRPGPGRRLRAVRTRRHRRPGVPRHRPGGTGPPGGGARRSTAPAPCTPGWPPPTRRPPAPSCPATAAASSGRWRSSRSPASPSPPTCPATRRSTTPSRSASTSPAPSSTSGSPPRVDRMWEAGLVDEVRALEAARAARGAYGVACARLPAGARGARGGVHGGGSARRDGARHQALRAPPGFLVPPRPPGALAQRRGRRTGQNCRTKRWRWSNERSQPDHVMASGRPARQSGAFWACHHRPSIGAVESELGGRVAMEAGPRDNEETAVDDVSVSDCWTGRRPHRP